MPNKLQMLKGQNKRKLDNDKEDKVLPLVFEIHRLEKTIQEMQKMLDDKDAKHDNIFTKTIAYNEKFKGRVANVSARIKDKTKDLNPKYLPHWIQYNEIRATEWNKEFQHAVSFYLVSDFTKDEVDCYVKLIQNWKDTVEIINTHKKELEVLKMLLTEEINRVLQ